MRPALCRELNTTSLGTFGIDAIIARDYQQVQGFALLTALAFVIMNLVVDLTYTFLDPRIRYA